ncbi:hypothetical protein K1719_028273 [Acacia pycnantha]|nr:hypothetical protein K1719_028273 [Acacia pycnantha]
MGKHSTHQLLGSLLICTIILLSSSCAVKRTLAEQEPEKRRSWKGHELPPEPYKGYYEWLVKCGEKLTDKCGEQVADFLFYKRTQVSYGCCDRLVNVAGHKCHKEMTKTLAHTKDFKNYKAQILKMSKIVWHQCSSLISLSPMAEEY